MVNANNVEALVETRSEIRPKIHQRTRTDGLTRWWFAAIGFLVLIAVLYLYPFVFDPSLIITPASNLGTDLVSVRWTDTTSLLRAVREEQQYPLWDPIVMGGHPTVGNPGIIQYYPAFLLLFAVPQAAAFTWMYVLHVWLGGVGMLILLRVCYRSSRTAALLGSVAFMLAPKFTGHLAAGHFDMTFPALLLPWSFIGIMLALERKQAFWAFFASLPLALGYLLHIQSFFFATFYVGLYLLWRLVIDWQQHKNMRQGIRHIFLSALVPIGVVLFGALQWMPFAGLLSYASRQHWTLADGGWWSLPPALLGGLVILPRTQFPEWTMYLGILPLTLLLIALLKRRSDVLFLAGFVLFSIVFSLGINTPLYEFFFRYVPGFGLLRVPPRMMFIAAVPVAVLAGLGWDALSDRVVQQRVRRLFPLAASAALIVFVVLVGGYIVLFNSTPLHIIRTGVIVGGACAVVWVVSSGKNVQRTLVSALAIGILIVDLMPIAWNFLAPATQAATFPPSPVLDYIRDQGGLYRAYAVRGNLSYEGASERNIHLLDAQRSFQFSHMAELINVATGCDFRGFSAGVPSCTTGEAGKEAAFNTRPNAKLLGLLNVRWIAADFPFSPEGLTPVGEYGAFTLFENPFVLPRAFVAGQVVVVPDDNAEVEVLSDGDPAQVATISESASAGEPLSGASAPATITRYTHNQIEIETTIQQPGMLIVSDTWMQGWQATNNGVSVPVERVNVAMRGIRLTEPGTHRIVMTYQPPQVAAGLAISAITLIVFVGWGVGRTLNRRRGH